MVKLISSHFTGSADYVDAVKFDQATLNQEAAFVVVDSSPRCLVWLAIRRNMLDIVAAMQQRTFLCGVSQTYSSD